MAKFPIGSTVKYNGANESLRLYFSTGMKVIDVIPDEVPIGNGEINKSGRDIYRLEAPSGIIFNFFEDELTEA